MEFIFYHCIMKVAILIPDRGDRQKFLFNCIRMMEAQTIQPAEICIVSDSPINDDCDITWRYRTGYDRLRGKNLDCIFFIENDDYYHPKYIEYMIDQWNRMGRPDMLGMDYTIYYHIKLFKHFTMNHKRRSSAMNMMIKPDLSFPWPVDKEPYTDLHLWMELRWRKHILSGAIIHPDQHYCIGIKHGEGLTGGRNHTDYLHRYVNDDAQKTFIRSVMDDESFKFYSEYYE